MKKRRLTLVAFMLIAVMVLGIGYAVVSDVLNISGSAELSQANAQIDFADNIYFTALDTSGLGANDTATIVEDTTKDTIAFTIKSLSTIGESVSLTATISNFNIGYSAELEAALSTGVGNGYFDVTWDWVDDKSTIAAAADASTPGTQTIKVTITLVTPYDDPNGATISKDLNVEITATGVVVTP